jgi:chemotaxis protein CheD
MASLRTTTSTFRLPLTVGNVPLVMGRKTVYLLPGELHASAEQTQVTTILGSCVSVCLWDQKLRIGGMNHFLLPMWREGGGRSTRFGDLAIRELLERMLRLGAQRKNLQAKMFGGAALFNGAKPYESSLGAKNVETAHMLLKQERIALMAQDTGGEQGRKLVFNTDDGTAFSRQV